MSERVSALFAVHEDAERAAAALLDHGGDREEISLDEEVETVARTEAAPRELVLERAVLAETGTMATPDWHRAARDLEWSWHRSTGKHRQALDLQEDEREGAGFDMLLNIQRENPSVQQDYRACLAADGDRFWHIAREASKPLRR